MGHIANIEQWSTGTTLMHGIRRPKLKYLSVPLYVMCDLVVLIGANLATHLLLEHMPMTRDSLQAVLQDQTLLQVSVPFLCLALGGRVYQRVWHMAGTMDYAALVIWTVIGIILSSGWALVLGIDPHPAATLYATGLYIGLALVPLLCLHSFMRLFADLPGSVRLPFRRAGAGISVLVFGTAPAGRLFLQDRSARHLKSGRRLAVKGFLDQDTNLHGRLVHGIRVYGGMQQVEEAAEKTSARIVIVADELSRYDLQELRQRADRAGMAVALWEPVMRNAAAGARPEDLSMLAT